MFIDEQYGGLGLSQSGYCRVMEEFGYVDGTLAVVMGVHQSIGTKPLYLFGTDDQKARWLPDLAAGRKLAAFVLTEPNVGSDAYNLETWAERQSDGIVAAERREALDRQRRQRRADRLRPQRPRPRRPHRREGHGGAVSTGPRFDTLGLKANHLQRVHFKNVRVPAENLLGEPGDGFRIAMNTLNNGRMSMGTAISGGMKRFLELALEHAETRKQFDRHLIDFEMVEDKLAWMAAQIYGLESSSYLTTGMVDARRRRLLARERDDQGGGQRSRLVRPQPRVPDPRRRGVHGQAPAGEGAARLPHLPDLRGLERRDARLRRAQRLKALSEDLPDVDEHQAQRPRPGVRRARAVRAGAHQPHPAPREAAGRPPRVRRARRQARRPGQPAARQRRGGAAQARQEDPGEAARAEAPRRGGVGHLLAGRRHLARAARCSPATASRSRAPRRRSR